MSFVWSVLSSFVSGLLSRWWGKVEQQQEIADATEPYKKELEIKNRPAGTDNDIVGRL